MDNKYWVPALDRAHRVLQIIAKEPGKWKLINLCKQLEISKSTMFSLLQTMETLQWITRNTSDTYTLGVHFGLLGNAYFQQFDLIDLFRSEAQETMQTLKESIQLARLDGKQILYLAKVEAPSHVQMISGPGARFPAHATGLGKVMLMELTDDEWDQLWTEDDLAPITPHTITNKKVLMEEVKIIKQRGYALDIQEGVMGFCCIAAPVFHVDGKLIASVSASMPIHNWDEKKEAAIKNIVKLGQILSFVK